MEAFYFIQTLIWDDPIEGFPTLVIIVLLLGGLQLLSLGIIGKYIAKIFLETKKRPNYIIKESNIKSPHMRALYVTFFKSYFLLLQS